MAKPDHKHPLPRYGNTRKRHAEYNWGYSVKRWGGKEPKTKSASYIAGWLAADAEARRLKKRGRDHD